MMAADYRHIGGRENRLGRHYSRFAAFWPAPTLAGQSLALRKLCDAGSNRRSRASSAPIGLVPTSTRTLPSGISYLTGPNIDGTSEYSAWYMTPQYGASSPRSIFKKDFSAKAARDAGDSAGGAYLGLPDSVRSQIDPSFVNKCTPSKISPGGMSGGCCRDLCWN